MKKFLLSALIAIAAIGANAQTSAVNTDAVKVKQSMNLMRKAPEAKCTKDRVPFKSVLNGVYYARPEGSMFLAWDKEGSGYRSSVLLVPPYTDLWFYNKSTVKGDPIWTYNTTDITDDADAAGNLDFGTLSSADPEAEVGSLSYYYLPTLTIGNVSYTLGTEGKYSAYASDGSGIAVQGLTTMSQADQHNGGYGFGSLDTHYLYGTGYVTTSTGVKHTCYAIEQDFDKPMSPLYIEDAFLDFYSTQANPIPEGKELTMRFVELDDEGYFGETIAEFTATGSDIYNVQDVSTSIKNALGYDGSWYSGSVVFANKSQDSFGAETLEPIIINKRFAVIILGVDQEGVSIGFTSTTYTADSGTTDCNFICEEEGTGDSYYHYYGDCSLGVSFTAKYDKILAPFASTFVAPVEGGVAVSDDEDLDEAAYMYTAFPWTDTDSNENYFVDIEYGDEDPEWLDLGLGDYWNEPSETTGNPLNLILLQFTAQALPAGVEGRIATVHVYGPADEATFFVKQGEVADGINIISTAKTGNKVKTYNLMGQEVKSNTKGLVIRDGKKLINK